MPQIPILTREEAREIRIKEIQRNHDELVRLISELTQEEEAEIWKQICEEIKPDPETDSVSDIEYRLKRMWKIEEYVKKVLSKRPTA